MISKEYTFPIIQQLPKDFDLILNNNHICCSKICLIAHTNISSKIKNSDSSVNINNDDISLPAMNYVVDFIHGKTLTFPNTMYFQIFYTSCFFQVKCLYQRLKLTFKKYVVELEDECKLWVPKLIQYPAFVSVFFDYLNSNQNICDFSNPDSIKSIIDLLCPSIDIYSNLIVNCPGFFPDENSKFNFVKAIIISKQNFFELLNYVDFMKVNTENIISFFFHLQTINIEEPIQPFHVFSMISVVLNYVSQGQTNQNYSRLAWSEKKKSENVDKQIQMLKKIKSKNEKNSKLFNSISSKLLEIKSSNEYHEAGIELISLQPDVFQNLIDLLSEISKHMDDDFSNWFKSASILAIQYPGSTNRAKGVVENLKNEASNLLKFCKHLKFDQQQLKDFHESVSNTTSLIEECKEILDTFEQNDVE